MKKRNNKGALQISFAWIFAILVGAFILFLAIFAVTKFIDIEKTKQDAETGREIGILLNPLEMGFETGKVTSLSNSVNTRISCGCSESGFFGKQTIKVSQEVYGKWSETNTPSPFQNKYIFAENPVEGKKFYVFTKPFEFPFKVADLIYIIPSKKNYCFLDTPAEIEDELLDLKKKGLLDNILLVELEDCPSGSVRVCFEGGGTCNVIVGGNYIEKGDDIIYFEGDALMYAGIFSDKEIYECQLKRLMKRTEQLSLLYKYKLDFVFERAGCISDIKPELLILNNLVKNFDNSEEIFVLNSIVEDIQLKNKNGECRLW